MKNGERRTNSGTEKEFELCAIAFDFRLLSFPLLDWWCSSSSHLVNRRPEPPRFLRFSLITYHRVVRLLACFLTCLLASISNSWKYSLIFIRVRLLIRKSRRRRRLLARSCALCKQKERNAAAWLERAFLVRSFTWLQFVFTCQTLAMFRVRANI